MLFYLMIAICVAVFPLFIFFINSSFLFFICQYGILNSKIIKKNNIIYNILIIFLIELLFFVFTTSESISMLLSELIFFILSILCYYVHEFRGINVNFSDILSISTAKEVAGGYKYNMKFNFFISLLLCILLYFVSNYIRYLIPYYPFSFYENINTNINTNVVYLYIVYVLPVLFLMLIIIFFILRNKISNSLYDYSLNAGEKEGYIYNLFSSIPIFHSSYKVKLKKNEYNDNIINLLSLDKEKLINNIDINNKNPHIIVIMNESFGSVHERIKTNIKVTPYYDNLQGVTKGKLFVNTFGGGTANTEFEFLTSVTIGNLPYPMYPYNNFVKHNKYSLVRYMKQIGYDTVAMHPYTATNYNRNIVYKYFGFDKLVFHDDFTHNKKDDLVRKYVSDKSMYLEVIDKYNQYKKSNKKLFLFGITMQNHSGYDKFEGEQVYVTDNIKYATKQLNSYLSLMKISDDAIKTLIEYFDKEDDRVVILFFGDHNASFSTGINKLYYDMSNDYEGTNQYMTPFFIYDNKNKNNDLIEKTSANFLAIDLLKKSNIPLNDYYKYINEIYLNNQYMNYHKTYDKTTNKLHYISDNLADYMQLVNYYLYS